ncbi:E3 ubiquitin ligase PQT3-like isoform X2 [Momordica charantia]|uniref:E3 ubiquitin ligase PQT3-like isoform X2 n=1 Tax=Momordica charantia TaxID=3673 RepID=A0A6J1DMD2_MOMCH|nr:E3 ubiquitin ligase PQT3-like isoform X2 [Momordica charantia]
MAVYYKFKSARDYDSIPMDGPFISVGTLKEKIFESKHLGRGTDFDLVVTNAQTNEEYLDEAMLIPKNTSVLIRRVPGRPRLPIVTKQEPKVEAEIEETEQEKSTVPVADPSALRFPEDSEWDEFGNDLYAIPEVLPVQPSNPIPDAAPTNKAEEDSKIKALIDTPALDWQHQGSDGFGPGRGFGRGGGGRMGGRGFGRAGFERKTPPQGYVCHRCKVPGHFIQHCPTNGDPNYDIKRVKPPTGIPKSMLMATPDGSYALPSGAVAVLRPNEAAFEKEIEGLPSTRSVGDLPPELHCPLCKEVMKDAVLTSKCCFKSFCDKCIRDHIISRSACICGATNILADDLLPNKTLRDTINRILESGNSSADNAGSTFQVQDMESARIAQPKVPSPTLSAASKGEKNILSINEDTMKTKEIEEGKAISSGPQTLEKVKATKAVESEATHESMSVKEQASQGSALLVDEEVQQKMAASEAVKKKKKKKVRMPANDFQWKTSQDLATENYMMPIGGPTPYNPYWTGMQPGFDGYMSSYAAPLPYMGGYGLGPLEMPFGPVMPQDPFGMQSYMFPVAPPQRDLADFSMGMNIAPPAMSREEFEARKANMRRKQESERRVESREREPPNSKDREFGREVSSSGDVPPMKLKSKFAPQTSAAEHNQNRRRSESSPDIARNAGPPCPPPRKRKSEHHDHDIDKDNNNDHYDHGHHRHHRQHSESRAASEVSAKSAATNSISAAADRKQKMSVFSRISFPEGETKKRKLHSSKEAPPSDSGASAVHHKASSNGYYDDYKAKTVATSVTSSRGRSSAASVDCESSDDDRHFKRKPSRYEPSPPPPADWDQEESRHPRGSTRVRESERSSYSKHR